MVSFLNALFNNLFDIRILYDAKKIVNIQNIRLDGNRYISAFKMPFKPYLANILLIEKLSTKLLKKTIINIIGIPIIDKPSNHIIIVYIKLEYNAFLNISILLLKFIFEILLKKVDV